MPVAPADPYRQVDIRNVGIDHCRRCIEADLDVRVQARIGAEPGDQPFRGEYGGHRDGQHPFVVMTGCRDRLVDRPKTRGQPRQQNGARLGGHECPSGTVENGASELPFRLQDLLAHGAGRDRELVRGFLNCSKPPDGFKRPQAVEVDTVQLFHLVFLYDRVGNLHGFLACEASFLGLTRRRSVRCLVRFSGISAGGSRPTGR